VLGALKGIDLFEGGAKMVLLDLEVVAGLQVEPEPVGGAEVAGQAQRGVRGDASLAVDDLVDPPWRDGDGDRQVVLGDLKGVRKSSRRTSPGWIGAMVAIGVPPSG